jgi:hypothetical protein
LLQERLVIVLIEQTQNQNCATVAIKYIVQRLGKSVTDQNLAELVSGPNKSTSLYALRQFAQDLDLHCLAVQTNIKTLKNLKNTPAILHFPKVNHYVVLEYIDNENVWIIDLDSNKFFYRTALNDFSLTWSEGTALLISDKPLVPDPNDTLINDSDLHNIIGSTEGGFSSFSCTELIQRGDIILCPERIGDLCGGHYVRFYWRCGCEPDPNGVETCETEIPPKVGNMRGMCVEKVGYPNSCETTAYNGQGIRACIPEKCPYE